MKVSVNKMMYFSGTKMRYDFFKLHRRTDTKLFRGVTAIFSFPVELSEYLTSMQFPREAVDRQQNLQQTDLLSPG